MSTMSYQLKHKDKQELIDIVQKMVYAYKNPHDTLAVS
jgi:hypothetical protein